MWRYLRRTALGESRAELRHTRQADHCDWSPRQSSSNRLFQSSLIGVAIASGTHAPLKDPPDCARISPLLRHDHHRRLPLTMLGSRCETVHLQDSKILQIICDMLATCMHKDAMMKVCEQLLSNGAVAPWRHKRLSPLPRRGSPRTRSGQRSAQPPEPSVKNQRNVVYKIRKDASQSHGQSFTCSIHIVESQTLRELSETFAHVTCLGPAWALDAPQKCDCFASECLQHC